MLIPNQTKLYQQGPEWMTDPDLSEKHLLTENIVAAYSFWQIQVNTQTKVVTGLRYEYTDKELHSATLKGIIDRRYSQPFPSLSVSHTFSGKHSCGVSYGKRINRPSFNDLAPFVMFCGPNNFESGNPALQPTLSHIVKLQYQWDKLIASLQYSYEDKPFAGYQPHLNSTTNELFNYAENLRKAHLFTLSLALPSQITAWWNMQNSLLVIGQKVEADYLPVPEQLINYHVRLNSVQRFLLPHGLSLEVSGYYQSPFLYGIYMQKATGVLNLGIQKQLRNDKGTVSLTWDDLFWTTAWRWDYDRPHSTLHQSF